jgi:Ca2+ transporting ATPase
MKKTEFASMASDILAVYRVSPEEKFKFISGLSITSCAAITGESNSDALAIGAASVGFAMGEKGCEVSKAAADIVMLDNNFESIFNAVRWGRNVFDNIRKFI